MGGGGSHFQGKCPPSRIIETTYGPVVGRRIIHEGDRQVDAFQGIPFAKPPIGELRFRHPEPPTHWKDPRQCVAFGHRGIQNDALFWAKWKYGKTSEDNLYLNVFSPVWTPPADGFAVMVFIHGGGFVCDSTVKYGDIGIAQNLVRKDVVVVTIQYRLGYLGFWSTGDDECPDNLGLWDQTFALQWVHDNIWSFGGNPNNVTIFGQSAGGASVDLLTLSPHSRDLFHKVIPMAGNASCEWSIHRNSVEVCRELAAKHGIDCTTDSLTYLKNLRRLDAMKFATSLKIDPSTLSEMQVEIGPRFDGKFFPRPISDLRTEAPSKPRMVGCCTYEGLIMMLFDGTASVSRMEEVIASMIPETEFDDFKERRQEILERCIDLQKSHHPKEEVQRAQASIFGDAFLNIGCQKNVIDCLQKGDAPVYFYSFDYFNPKSWGLIGMKFPFKGATHCTELSYMFAVGIISEFKFNDTDRLMLDRVSRMWTNFAKYGDPNGSPSEPSSLLHFRWEPATLENPQHHLSIDTACEMRDVYQSGRPIWWLKTREERRREMS